MKTEKARNPRPTRKARDKSLRTLEDKLST
jgi:hypothetical protein